MMMNPPMNSMMNQNNMMMNPSSMIPMAMSPPPMNSMSMGMTNSILPRICGDDDDEDVCYMVSSNNNNNSFIPSSSYHGNEMKDIQETIDTNKKEDIMKIINTQDFINGFWEDNEYTNIIKEKYKEEYNLLKGIKNKNITDKVAITILIIYFIEKEHPELLDELLMIIKKAKIFILNEAKETYENIIKEISIS